MKCVETAEWNWTDLGQIIIITCVALRCVAKQEDLLFTHADFAPVTSTFFFSLLWTLFIKTWISWEYFWDFFSLSLCSSKSAARNSTSLCVIGFVSTYLQCTFNLISVHFEMHAFKRKRTPFHIHCGLGCNLVFSAENMYYPFNKKYSIFV